MSETVLADLRGILASLAESKGCFVLEINGEADHIHLLLQMPPQISVSNLVGFLKANSSKITLERFPELRTFSNRGYFLLNVILRGILQPPLCLKRFLNALSRLYFYAQIPAQPDSTDSLGYKNFFPEAVAFGKLSFKELEVTSSSSTSSFFPFNISVSGHNL